MRLGDLRGYRVGVWGLGVEGDAAARAAEAAGAAQVVVVDHEASVVAGRWQLTNDTQVLASCDVVIRSPGISRYRTDARELAARTLVVTGTALALAELLGMGQRVLCITGTKGKSTTSALVATILEACGVSAAHVGNNGKPMLGLLLERETTPLPDVVVAEISSYQAADVEVSPSLGAITSLAPEHLDWHGSIDRYYADKMNLFVNYPDALIVVSNQAIQIAAEYLPLSTLRTPDQVVDTTVLASYSQGTLLGQHNRENVRLALACCARLGINLQSSRGRIEAALQAFQGLPHRLNPVASLDGVVYIDDVLSTTPLSVTAALEALGTHAVTLIAGGQDRGLDFDSLAHAIVFRDCPIRLITMPDSGCRIARSIRRASADTDRKSVVVYEVEDLVAAVDTATRVTSPDGIVLLSPGSPSYNRYANFKALGSAFADLLTKAGAVPLSPSQEAALHV
ncbi:MAG: UDP-N-acetylmuramoyl-L-alanine--D-glutamate ligase [Actinomycetota bacterium]|nr:UDP-N-acetylmuramoyl-L-alanine--D-glutamate ligase [Actinomycetota bacterium]